MSRGFRSIARKWFTRLLMVFVLFLCSDDGGTVEAAGYAEAGETPPSQNHLLGVAMTRAQDLMGVQTRGERTG